MRRLASAFIWAAAGIAYSLRTQPNMRVHVLAALLAVGLGWFTDISRVEWLILILTIMAVIAAELFNTAVEASVDLVSPDYHPLAKAAKDAAAGAVLTAAAASLVVGVILFGPTLYRLL